MSHSASIHGRDLAVALEGLHGISREQGWAPRAIVSSAPSQRELDTQLVMDRLLRECLARKLPREQARFACAERS